MKHVSTLASILLLCCSTGCLSVCNNAQRTLIKEPKQFSWRRDRCESRTLYRSWAADAWAEQRANGVSCASADFVLGFQDGFVEYCYAGGSGEPPPVPPRPYWNALNRVAPLNKGAYEWFDGYRLGARVARDGGYRDQAVVPVSASLCSKGGAAGDSAGCPCAPGASPESMPLTPVPAESLQAPAPLMDEAGAHETLLLPNLSAATAKDRGEEMSAVFISDADLTTPPDSGVVRADVRSDPAPPRARATRIPTEESSQSSPRFGNDFLR